MLPLVLVMKKEDFMNNLNRQRKLDIDHIIFIGRTYEEYLNMFNLSLEYLEGKRILDCPAGACSFSATARKYDIDVEACDLAYYFKDDVLYEKGNNDIKHMINKMEHSKLNYNWTFFKDLNDLEFHRKKALETCVKDMKNNQDKYCPVEMPQLPYNNNAFDVLLSAHFLFLYADVFDIDFHIQTIKEMIRVTKEEIRIFPLVDMGGKRYKNLDEIIKLLKDNGYKTSEIKVPYEFQVNANSFLKIQIQ